jgi:hypothetical protein
MRLRYRSWQRREPSFRFPFVSIRSPNVWVSVGEEKRYDNNGAFWYRDFVNVFTIQAFHWSRQWEHDVLDRPTRIILAIRKMLDTEYNNSLLSVSDGERWVPGTLRWSMD